MFKWIAQWFKQEPQPTKHSSSVITGVIGYNKPIEVIKEADIPCRCASCGTEWYQKIQNVYAITNSIYEYDYCSKCVDITKVDYNRVFMDNDNIIINGLS